MRQEKQLLLDQVSKQIGHYPSFVILQYTGVSATALNGFRAAVAKRGGEVEMVRKRLLIKAAQTAGISLSREALGGHVGLVYAAQDPIEMTKFCFDFRRDNEGVNVIGGRIDGELYTGAQVDALSKLPSKDELRAQLLGLFVAPMADVLGVVEALLTSVPHCLENKSQQQ